MAECWIVNVEWWIHIQPNQPKKTFRAFRLFRGLNWMRNPSKIRKIRKIRGSTELSTSRISHILAVKKWSINPRKIR